MKPNLESASTIGGDTERENGYLEALKGELIKIFFTVVPARDAATLVPIITQYVLPGTKIHTDEWRSYARLNASGFIHKTVYHSVNFVDPASGAYKQSLLGPKLKASIKGCMEHQMNYSPRT